MLWPILSALTAIITIALVLTGNTLLAAGVALVGIVLGAVGANREKVRREQRFRDRFHSVERIRETHDLSDIRRLRDESGPVVAVRAVRREFPGISLTDATDLVREV